MAHISDLPHETGDFPLRYVSFFQWTVPAEGIPGIHLPGPSSSARRGRGSPPAMSFRCEKMASFSRGNMIRNQWIFGGTRFTRVSDMSWLLRFFFEKMFLRVLNFLDLAPTTMAKELKSLRPTLAIFASAHMFFFGSHINLTSHQFPCLVVKHPEKSPSGGGLQPPGTS